MPDNETTTTTTTSTPIGYFDGVLDVYYAIFATDDTAAAAPTYGTPAVLGKSIEVTITPQYREGSMYASNARVRNERRISGYEVSLNLDQVIAAARRAVTGRRVDAKGAELIESSQVAPYCAIGFAITKDNGCKELWWLYKGKFAEFEKAANTQSDAIEYQTPTLTANFDARIFDGKVGIVLDTEADDADATVASGWFSAVYEETAATTSP